MKVQDLEVSVTRHHSSSPNSRSSARTTDLRILQNLTDGTEVASIR